MDTPDARCALLAAEQHGCLTVEQARRAGLSLRAMQGRVANKRWTRVLPGVFVVRGAPQTWEQRLFAAVLWAGVGAAVAGAAAAALWELPGFASGPVEIVHRGTKQSRDRIRVRRVRLDHREITRVGVIPVTIPARTLADISCRVGDAAFDAALHHCLHHRLTTIEELEEVAENQKRARAPGTPRMRRALGAYVVGGRPAASPLEARVSRRLQASRLPAFQRQHEVRVAGRRRFLDFAWPAAKVAVEVDGYRWHSSRTAWEKDRIRLTDLRRAGWTVIHVTQADLDEFGAVVEEIRKNL